MKLIDLAWDKSNKYFSIRWMRKYWKESGEGPDWCFRTNGALRNKNATCLDIHIHLGYLVIEYTDYAFRSIQKQ